VLKITPIEKSTPPEADPLAARLYAMLPCIRITDLLSEVAVWTLFTDWRDGCRPARFDGEPPGRRAQSRPDAHGGSLHDRQPREARLGGRLAHSMPWRCGVSSTTRSASRWRRYSAADLRRP
jgi:hypothetical protein